MREQRLKCCDSPPKESRGIIGNHTQLTGKESKKTSLAVEESQKNHKSPT